MPSLIDRDPHGVSFPEVEGFLQQGYPESERLEYKHEVQDTVADTLVAFANMDGGLIVVGVDESSNKPTAWDGVPQRDPLGTLANHNAALCTPAVRYDTELITNPKTGKPLLLIR